MLFTLTCKKNIFKNTNGFWNNDCSIIKESLSMYNVNKFKK